MQNDKLFMKKNTFSFFCMIQKKGIAPYGPNSIESDSGPSWGKKKPGGPGAINPIPSISSNEYLVPLL